MVQWISSAQHNVREQRGVNQQQSAPPPSRYMAEEEELSLSRSPDLFLVPVLHKPKLTVPQDSNTERTYSVMFFTM